LTPESSKGIEAGDTLTVCVRMLDNGFSVRAVHNIDGP